MSETPDVFNNEEKKDPQETPPVQEGDKKEETPQPESIFADQLSAIVNEEGVQKYHSVNDALKGAAHAQNYIRDLQQKQQEYENQLSELRQKLEQSKGVQDVIDTLNSSTSDEHTNSGGLDEQKIAELIRNTVNNELTATQQKQIANANRQRVNDTLLEQYGSQEAAAEALATKAQELDMSVQDLAQMSEKSPKAVLAYFSNAKKPEVDVHGTNRADGKRASEDDINWKIFSGASKAQKLQAWRAAAPKE